MASVGGFFRGTSATSDFRFMDSEKKLMKSMTFPENFNEKLDISKVNLDIMKTWIGKEITEIMGYEDDVLIDMIYNMLALDEKIDPKHIQITLTPFLDKNAASFTKHLWDLLLSAQQDVNGIPREFIEQRMAEIGKQEQQQTAIQDKISEALKVAKSEMVEKNNENRVIPILKKRNYASRSNSYSRSRRRSYSRSRRYNRSRRYSRSRSYSPSYDNSSERERRSNSRSHSRRRSVSRSYSRRRSDSRSHSRDYYKEYKTSRSRSNDRYQHHHRRHHSNSSPSDSYSDDNINNEKSSSFVCFMYDGKPRKVQSLKKRMEESPEDQIKSLQSKIALLKADRDDLYTKLAMAKQTVKSLHEDIGQIMEFIVDKRKDLSFIGPEFSSILNSDDEAKIHEMEFEYPNIHTLVYKDFEKALEENPNLTKIRSRGVELFKTISSENIHNTYPDIDNEKLIQYLDIIWKQMTFPEKQNWLEKRVVYSRTVESTTEKPTSPVQSPKQEQEQEEQQEEQEEEETKPEEETKVSEE